MPYKKGDTPLTLMAAQGIPDILAAATGLVPGRPQGFDERHEAGVDADPSAIRRGQALNRMTIHRAPTVSAGTGSPGTSPSTAAWWLTYRSCSPALP